MPARDVQLRWPPNPTHDGLESPFLSEDAFDRQTESRSVAHLGTMEAESQFGLAFEHTQTRNTDRENPDGNFFTQHKSPEHVLNIYESQLQYQLGNDQESETEEFCEEEAPPGDEELLSDYANVREASPEKQEILVTREAGHVIRHAYETAHEGRASTVEDLAFIEAEEDVEPEEGRLDPAVFEAENIPELPAGKIEVGKLPLLRSHRGAGPDLILLWNDMARRPLKVDVVVHLHGYSTRADKLLHLMGDIVPRSGIDWSAPKGSDGGLGRTRPTIGILPRGHFFGGKSGRAYSFPAITTQTGLQELIDFGLIYFSRSMQVPGVALGRLIITAHSGGGAALLRLLRHNDPDEVHIFDGLYQDAAELIRWAKARIERDRAGIATGTVPTTQYMRERGGALRVLCRGGTRRHSLVVDQALAPLLGDEAELVKWYRVEETSIHHMLIPQAYGWRLLANANADLPKTSPLIHARKRRQAFEEEAVSVEPEREVGRPLQVIFPSGERLSVLTGLPERKGDDYWDPTGSGNPLLDTGPAHKDKKLSPSFSVRELTTSGGVSADVARIDPKIVECLQRLRDHVGRDVKITSGYRSWRRNKQVYAGRKNADGTPKKPTLSQHCGGRAADITIKGMSGLEIGKAAVDACGPNIGVGLGYTFAHIDVRGVPVVWNYGGVKSAWIEEIKRYQRARRGTDRPSAGTAVAAKPSAIEAVRPPAELVRFAQKVLNAAEGERLTVDGDFGPLTRAALARFRRKHRLGTGDVLDETTELALAQRALEELAQQSIFARLGSRDGKTIEALREFRSQRGLGSDSALDAATRAALAEALGRRGGTIQPPAVQSGKSKSSGASGAGSLERAIAVVDQYRALADSAATKHGVDAALILGVIAAESGGNKDLVAKSGYTGLMQAGKGERHKQPATSIEEGTRKLRDFRAIMERVLKSSGRHYDQLAEAEQIRLLALAYNAGPVTVAKALQYASDAGDPNRWLDPEHYKRALLFTGAYSLKQAAASCLKGISASEQESRMREAVQVWNRWRLGTKSKSWRELDDPPPWSVVTAKLPAFIVCAIDFKHRNSPKYAAKILSYRDQFRSRGSTNQETAETEAREWELLHDDKSSGIGLGANEEADVDYLADHETALSDFLDADLEVEPAFGAEHDDADESDSEVRSLTWPADETELEVNEYEAFDPAEIRELDPALLDIAEKTIARETPEFEEQVSTRWTRCFSAADVAKVETVYQDNASAAGANSVDRCSCIVMLNVALGQLLSLPLKSSRARGTSTRTVQMGNLTTKSIEKAMNQLRNSGYAVAPTAMNFFDRRNRTAGTLKPERLKASVQTKVLDLAGTKDCWFAFGLSIMDGYHSVLLLVDRTSDDAKIYWLDQFSSGVTDDVTSSLDQRITDKTQAWWQAVMDEKGKGYNTTIRLWPLRKRRVRS